MPERRYLVVSDFHMAGGQDPRTGRWSPTEDFFWDGEFRDFLAAESSGHPTTLVVNGDLFDVLQVLVFPDEKQREVFRISESEVDRRYGLQCSEPCCEFLVQKILEGHPVFFEALADFLSAGNEVVILKGNHDVELYWPKVQERIREHLRQLVLRRGKKFDPSKLQFPPWFYYVRGYLYAEHGNQFEATTAFRHFVVPLLPALKRQLPTQQIELDLSSFLVRYVTNRTEPVNPLADNIRPLSRYYEILWKIHPFFVLLTFGTASRFVLKAFAKARQLRSGVARRGVQAIRRANDEAIHDLAVRFAGPDPQSIQSMEQHLHWFEEKRPTPTLVEGAWKFLFSMIGGGLRRAAWLIPVYLLTLIPEAAEWVRNLALESGVPWLADATGFLYRANLLHAVVVLLAGGLFLCILAAVRRKRERESVAFPDVSLEMREHARQISQRLQVRYVTFGHTHYADTSPLDGGGRYFNTGTWMGIFQPEEELYRGVRQFTFLRLTGGEAELLCWNAGKRRSDSVVVVDPQNPMTEAEDGIVKLLLRAVFG